MSESQLAALRHKYRYLYEYPVEKAPEGVRRFHRGAHWVRKGIHVLQLRGDAFEMAFQHGRLLEEQVSAGIIVQLSRTIPHLLENTVTKNIGLQRIMLSLIDWMGRAARRHIPETYFHETVALAEGARIPLADVSNALLAMEALYVLAKYAVQTRGLHSSPLAFGGCSSLAVWDSFARNGDLLIGRNLDYPLNEYFDKNPLVAYYEPTDGTQRYVTLASAGLYTPSLTAFNESGVYIAGHLVPTAETSFQGTPVYFLASEVLRKARSFDEATKLFQEFKSTLGWSFVLASFQEKRVGSVEFTHRGAAVRESKDGLHAQTNHFRLLRSANLFVNQSVDIDTYGREFILEQRIRSAYSPLDPSAVARILGDNFDPCAHKERAMGATVAVPITVGSAVFDPSQRKFFVGTGTAPVSHNRFVSFPFPGDFDGDLFASLPVESIQGGDFAVRYPDRAKGLQHYIKAKTAFEYRSDGPGSIAELRSALVLDPQEDGYRFLLAILLLRENDIAGGEAELRKLAAAALTPHMNRLGMYYLARILAHAGKKEEALQWLDKLLADARIDRKLRMSVERVARATRRFGRYVLRTEGLVPMFQFADMLHY